MSSRNYTKIDLRKYKSAYEKRIQQRILAPAKLSSGLKNSKHHMTGTYSQDLGKGGGGLK